MGEGENRFKCWIHKLISDQKNNFLMEKGIYEFASSESVLDLKSYYSLIIKLR